MDTSKNIQPEVHQGMQPQINQGMQPQMNQGMQPQMNQVMQPMVNYVPQPVVMAQPPSTTVVINQPETKNNLLIGTVTGNRGWSYELFDCFQDPSTCLFTCLCFTKAQSSLGSRTGENCFASACVPGYGINIRTRIRTLGGIEGDMFNDCLAVTFCGPCAVIQESRELKKMGII